MAEENALESAGSRRELSGPETQEQQKVSLLRQVREGLQADQRVYFAAEILHSPYGHGWLETVDIIVAPVKPIYDADDLNQFMHSLVPNIPRSAQKKAGMHNKRSDFSLGKLYFDETLGETVKEISITTTAIEPEALKRAGVHIGKSQETEKDPLKRRTWVRVYPDANSAKIIAEYEQGRKDGTVEPNPTFDNMHHWFSPKQFEQIIRTGKKPLIRRPKISGGKK